MSYRYRVVVGILTVVATMLIVYIAGFAQKELDPLSAPEVAFAYPPKEDWEFVFADEFDGVALDMGKWSTCFWWREDDTGDGCTNNTLNKELGLYRPEEVIVENGLLRLRAQQRTLGRYMYTSGMISSESKFNFQYGYVEARVKVPKGQGLWPAFWALPEERNVWPPEIDVVEIHGDEPTRVYMTHHWPDGDNVYDAATQSLPQSYVGSDFSEDFHRFGVLWEPGLLVWYVDGVERHRATNEVPTEPMYLIATLAIGGTWPGPPDRATPFPSYYDIDYIRVWQRSPGGSARQ